MEEEIKKIKRTQMKILMTMNEILNLVKPEHMVQLTNKINKIKIEVEKESDDEIFNYAFLSKRVDMLFEEFERFKKAHLERFFEYSTEGTEEDENDYLNKNKHL